MEGEAGRHVFTSPDADVWWPVLGAAGSVALGACNLLWALAAGVGAGELALLLALWLSLVAYSLSTTRAIAEIVVTPRGVETRGPFGWWPRALLWQDIASAGIQADERFSGVALFLVLVPRQGGAPLRISNRTSRFYDLVTEVRQHVAQQVERPSFAAPS